jgi:DNA-binding IclR family transcriptional regulator
LPQLELHAPRDIVVALGVLWEDQVIYIWHSEPGERTSASQALAGFRMLPAWQSVIGVSLLAAESDEALQPRFSDGQWQQIAPLLARKRGEDHLIWHRDDGEISMAQPIDNNRAALAFAKIWQPDEAHLAERLQQLQTLAQVLISPH